MPRSPFSLAFRLSLLYAGLCFVSMAAVLFISYLFLDQSMRYRIDEDLVGEVVEYRALLETQSMPVLFDVLEHEADSEGTVQTFFRVLDRNGTVLNETDMTDWPEVSVDRDLLAAALSGEVVFGEYRHPSREFPARVAYGPIGDGIVLHLAESTTSNAILLRHFRQMFFGATAAFVFCSLFAGVYMAKRSLAGVQRLTLAAVHITAGAWDHRAPISQHNDEIDELAHAFNTMVDRIQVLFRELREVTDDIAHDLRTPLMRIRGEAEMALRDAGNNALSEECCGSVLEECDQMLHLINTMLDISQTEAGAKPMKRGDVELDAVAEDVCDLFRPAAEDKDIELECNAADMPTVSGDLQCLQRAIAQLVDNAIKYTPAGGRIAIRCAPENGEAVVTVRDTGIGIPAEALQNVFSRFYRADASRSEAGNGLGLSLARAIVRAHGGDILVESSEGKGSVFTVRLPLRVDSA